MSLLLLLYVVCRKYSALEFPESKNTIFVMVVGGHDAKPREFPHMVMMYAARVYECIRNDWMFTFRRYWVMARQWSRRNGVAEVR